MADLVEVFRSSSTVEAQMLAQRLKDHGIKTALQGENLASSVGIASFVAPCRVLVRADQADEARAALAVLQASDELTDVVVPETCASCGEAWEPGFRECWSCQEPLGG